MHGHAKRNERKEEDNEELRYISERVLNQQYVERSPLEKSQPVEDLDENEARRNRR